MIKKLLLTICLILFLPVWAGAAIDYYEDFEGQTIDQTWSNEACIGQDTFYKTSGTVAGNWPNCYDYIEDDYNDRSSPNAGGKYFSIYCDWVNCAGMNNSRRAEFMMAQDTSWTPCNAMKYNDDTEYWIGWSYYIPADYYSETYSHQVFQIVSGAGNIINLLMYYGGDSSDSYTGRIRYNGTNHYPTFSNWLNDKGTWVDFAIHAIFHTTNDTDAVLELYKNGVLSMGADSDGYANVDAGTVTLGLPELYNQYCYSSIYTCADVIKTYATPMSPWRSVHIDEYRLTENTKGTENYCSVAPPIWAAKPTITVPAADATGIGQTFTAEFSGYSDHRTDAQACFSAYQMNVEVDEDGGDWGTLVYDSGDISTASTHEISGLAGSTTYQMRVRHSSYCAARATEYWGEWSNTTDFTTTTGGAPADPFDDILLWWRCEALDFSGTNGTLDYSAEDDIAAASGSAAINTDSVKYGTNGLDCPTNSSWVTFTVSSDDIVDADEGRIGFWYYQTTQAGDGFIARFILDTNNKSSIAIYDTDGLNWSWTDGSTARTTLNIVDADLDPTTWYFIEAAWKVSTGYRELFVDGVSKGSSSATIGTFEPTSLLFGNISDVANDWFLDNIMVSNDSTRDFNALKAKTDFPGYARLGAIGTTDQNGSYGINATLTVPIMFVDGSGNPKEVTWTDAALPYGYLLTETGATDLRLYHSSPPTTVPASTHWFRTHATDADYVNSMIAADMVSADLSISSIELEGGTFDATMTIPTGENLNDNSAVVIDGTSEGLSDAVIALCDSDGVAKGANTTNSTVGTIYASVTYANSEAGYVSVGPVSGLGFPLSLTNGNCIMRYADTQPDGWGQGYNEWLLAGALEAGDRDDGTECVLSGTALTKPAEGKIEVNGNELSDYDWPSTDILSGFTWRVLVPYPSTSPKEFDSTNTVAAALAAGFYFLPDDFAEATEANSIGSVDLLAYPGTSGHPITINGGGFEDNYNQTFGDYWTIKQVKHSGTIILGANNIHKYSLILSGGTLRVAGANCEIENDVIKGIFDVDVACTARNVAIPGTVSLANGITLTPTNCYFSESKATIEAAGGTVTDTNCQFSVDNFGFVDEEEGDFRIKRTSVLYQAGYNTGADFDLFGRPTPRGIHDIGAHEFYGGVMIVN